ncbi:MAG: MMPL family transporter [Acidimicrobiales bacterium]
MTSLLYRLGNLSARRPWLMIGLWAAAAALVISSSMAFGRESEDTFDAPGTDSEIAGELLRSAQSERAGVTARVVASPADPAGVDVIGEELAALPNVLGVDEVTSADGSVALFTVQYDVLEQLDTGDLDRLKETVAELRTEVPLQVEAGGELFFNFEEAGGRAELIGLGAAVIILLLAFGSAIAAGLPIGIAVFGLALGVSAMPIISHVIMIPSWAPQMGSMIGLGVGIDYALFLVTRHRELLARGLPVDEAAGRAVATAGQAVVFAGGTVVIAILGLAVAGLPFLTAAGIATSVIVLLMVLASVTLLPAFLGLSGPWINRFGIHRRGHTAGEVGPLWRRWGDHVAGHARAYAAGVTVALVALTAPVLALRLGFPDEGTMAETRTERRAYDLAAQGFGPGFNAPLLVAVDLDGVDDPSVLGSLTEAISADAGIAAVSPPEVSPGGDVATIVAFPTTTPQDDTTYETVLRLRSDVLPAALAGTDASAHITGQTANVGDVASQVSDRLPWFIAAVVGVSFLLLMVVFRSVLVALKAAVLNLLSIGAAYGLLVMVFQWGWGQGLIGLETTVPVVSFIPMFMFAILFGLSMDYEVFLLSRIREAYVETGNNDEAVVRGLAGTGRVISSAALIMISVFAAFVLGDDPVVKMMGLGLASAILVDATVVRMVLVPATMKLLGDANWWLPDWLDRILPVIDIDPGTERPSTGDGSRGEVGAEPVHATVD